MPRSLSLVAYMAYARRTAQAQPKAIDAARPEGELVWAHAADATRAEALNQIAERLAQHRPGLHLLLTLPDQTARPRVTGHSVIVQPAPEESTTEAETFLSHWQPDLCLWTGGDLRPALLTLAYERDIPLYLIDADEAQMDRPSWRWFPDLPRAVLKTFSQIQARSEDAARSLRRIGVPDADIHITGALRSEAIPLPFDEAERDEMAHSLLGRPIWLAAHLHLDELSTVLEARQIASRLSHRLILVLSPEDTKDIAKALEAIQAQDLRICNWIEGEMPTETTQVILTEPGEALGLWYRLSPVCFMGCSLRPGMCGHDPNEPAVHGSAVLYGPNVRTHLTEYSRFAEARAARIVRDAETMAAAVGQLIAPDQAASMAHAAWDVSSQGAEVTDRILNLVQDTLDVVGER